MRETLKDRKQASESLIRAAIGGGSIVISLFLFVLIILLKLSPALTKPFSGYSPALFLAVLILYIASYNLPGRMKWLTVLSLSTTLFALNRPCTTTLLSLHTETI